MGSFTSGHVHLVRLDVRQLVSLIRPQPLAVRPLDKAVLLMRSLGIAGRLDAAKEFDYQRF